jgi:hypothetical protein
MPSGAVLVGDTARTVPLLQRLERLRGTPLAQAARAARERIADCEEFEAHCPPGDGCGLFEALTCRAARPGLAAVHAARGDNDWFFADSPAEGPWVRAWGRDEAPGVTVARAEIAALPATGALALLLPAEEPPGPPQLSADELLHLRLRPDGGLDVASLIPAEGFGARLFQLQSELFAGAVLAGVWELAVYPPREDQRIPPVALAVDFKNRPSAVRVMEGFLAELQETWPVRRSPFALAGWDGACLGNLRVLPDLAPCYVATERALVVGWNSYSLGRALSGPAGPDGGASALEIDFGRLPETDGLLAQASGAEPGPPIDYPFSRARLSGRRDGDRYRVELRLDAREPAR